MRATRVWVVGWVTACSHTPAAPVAPDGGSGGARLELVAGALGGWGTADGTGTAARLGNLGQLATSGGRLYVPSHDVVRVIDLATAAVTTERSVGGVDLFGIASDASGVLYAVDDVANAIFRRDPATATWQPLAPWTFDAPVSLASDGGHVLFVGEAGDKAIRSLDLATGTVRTLATGFVGDPIGLAYDGAGTLYVAERETSVLRTVDVATGTLAWFAGQPGTSGGLDGDAATATFDGPDALALDGHGSLWVSDGLGETVRRIDLVSREVTTELGSFRASGARDAAGTDARFDLVTGLAFAGEQLYLADSGNGELRRADLATRAVETYAGSIAHPGTADGVAGDARFSAPRGMAVAGDGALYVADSQNDAIRRVDLATGAVATVEVSANGLPRGLSYPIGVAATGDTLFVAEAAATDIVTIDLATRTATPLAAAFTHPRWLASDGAQRLVVSDVDAGTGAPILRVIELGGAGTVTTLPIDVTLADIGGLAFAGDDVLVADPGSGVVWRIALATGRAELVAHVAGAGALDVDASGTLHIAAADGTVRAIVLATGATTTLAGRSGQLGCAPGPLPGGLNVPAGLAGGPGGALYISDAAENAILVVR
ncbi:MAG: hypothetical protein ACM31C_01640 [Acidobacteriota bacterium]